MMRKQTVILLTACISPGGMAFTALQDAGERERQYIDAINFYIENTHYPIVFCNNSGEDISSKITYPKGRVEFLSYYGNDYDKQLGKGYGEFQIIEYALRHSQFLNNAHTIIKITGRLKVFGLASQIRLASICYWLDTPFILVANIAQKERFARSECIITSKSFYEKYFLVNNKINDSQHYYFEHLLFDVAAASPYELKIFCLPLQVEGISGSTGTKYTQSKKSDIEQLQYLRNNLLQIATNESNEWYQNGWYRFCAGAVRIWKAILLRIK